MASGSNKLATYYAKRIIGDSTASSQTSALLQTGASVTADTWILSRTDREGTSIAYGVKYDHGSTGAEDKLELYGGSDSSPTAWVQLSTGNTSILGRTGIGVTPNSYQFEVLGTSKLDGATTCTGVVTITDNTSSTSKTTGALQVTGGVGIQGNLYANKVYNAVWNDYAEFRECDLLRPGTCVQEQDDGHLRIADKRLIPGASIITDTFGYIQGETPRAKTPIAISGRVLAYTYRARKKYHAGMAVCSAPNGTVDIMSKKEIRKHPDAIIGIVSEIPTYETWGSDGIQVDNRIWIKLR